MSAVPGAPGSRFGPRPDRAAVVPRAYGDLSPLGERAQGFAAVPPASWPGVRPGRRAARPSHSLREPREV